MSSEGELPIAKVGGIGPASSAKLRPTGSRRTQDFANMDARRFWASAQARPRDLAGSSGTARVPARAGPKACYDSMIRAHVLPPNADPVFIFSEALRNMGAASRSLGDTGTWPERSASASPLGLHRHAKGAAMPCPPVTTASRPGPAPLFDDSSAGASLQVNAGLARRLGFGEQPANRLSMRRHARNFGNWTRPWKGSTAVTGRTRSRLQRFWTADLSRGIRGTPRPSVTTCCSGRGRQASGHTANDASNPV
jgi:hypothetical protein